MTMQEQLSLDQPDIEKPLAEMLRYHVPHPDLVWRSAIEGESGNRSVRHFQARVCNCGKDWPCAESLVAGRLQELLSK